MTHISEGSSTPIKTRLQSEAAHQDRHNETYDRSYPLEATNDEMWPRIRDGNLVYACPGLEIRPNDEVFIVLKSGATMIRSVKSESKRAFSVLQHKPFVETRVLKKHIERIDRIVGVILSRRY
jgi:phage repressor protein C with HTH and peptisase S24 domain